MKVTLTATEGALEVSGADDFKLTLGMGTSLILEIKDATFELREGRLETAKPVKKPGLRVVK